MEAETEPNKTHSILLVLLDVFLWAPPSIALRPKALRWRLLQCSRAVRFWRPGGTKKSKCCLISMFFRLPKASRPLGPSGLPQAY